MIARTFSSASQKIVNALLILLVAALALSCGKDKVEPTEEQKLLTELSGSEWTLHDATVDLMNVKDQFPSMKLLLKTDNTYVVTNGVSKLWPSSGKFAVSKDISGHFLFTRDDGMVMKVEDHSTAALTLSFQYTSTGGRIDGISGKYTFSFVH
jgi:hypothetical protein